MKSILIQDCRILSVKPPTHPDCVLNASDNVPCTFQFMLTFLFFSNNTIKGPSQAQGRRGLLKSGTDKDVVVVFLCVRKVRVGWESAGEKYERWIVPLFGVVGGVPSNQILLQDVCRSDSKAFRGISSCETKPISKQLAVFQMLTTAF